MKLQHKVNNREIEMPKEAFEKFSADQKKNYTILNASDAPEEKKVVAENIVTKKEIPATGEKKVDASEKK